jgi:MFS family permease
MMFVMMAYSIYNTYIIEFAKERGIEGIGAFYTVMAGALIISRPLSGTLTDKFGIGRVLFPGMAIFAVSYVIVGSSTTLTSVLIGAVVAAIGYGATQPSLQAMCIQTVPPLKRGVASNTLYIGIDLGLFFGPIVGSIVCDYFNYATMYKVGFVPVVLAITALAIILPGYFRRRRELAE